MMKHDEMTIDDTFRCIYICTISVRKLLRSPIGGMNFNIKAINANSFRMKTPLLCT